MEDPRTLKQKIDHEYAALQLLESGKHEERILKQEEAHKRLIAQGKTKPGKRVRVNPPISERLKRHFQVKELTK